MGGSSLTLNIHATDCLDCRIKLWQLECVAAHSKSDESLAARVRSWIHQVGEDTHRRRRWRAWRTGEKGEATSPSTLKRRHSTLSQDQQADHHGHKRVPTFAGDRDSVSFHDSHDSMRTSVGSAAALSWTRPRRAPSGTSSSTPPKTSRKVLCAQHRSRARLQGLPSDSKESVDAELMLRTPNDLHRWRSLQYNADGERRKPGRWNPLVDNDIGRYAMAQVCWTLLNFQICDTGDIKRTLSERTRRRRQHDMGWGSPAKDTELKKVRSGPPQLQKRRRRIFGEPFWKWIEQSWRESMRFDIHLQPPHVILRVLELACSRAHHEPQIIRDFRDKFIHNHHYDAAILEAAGSYLTRCRDQQVLLGPHDLLIPAAFYFFMRYSEKVNAEVQLQDALVLLLDDFPWLERSILPPWSWPNPPSAASHDEWSKDVGFFLAALSVRLDRHPWGGLGKYLNSLKDERVLRGRWPGPWKRSLALISVKTM